MKHISIDHTEILKFKKISSERKGILTPIYNKIDIPFNVRRVYYLYDIPSGVERGGHAHKKTKKIIIAASGSFDVTINDGSNKKTIHLNKPSNGLYIPSMLWRELSNFSSGSVCLVLTSTLYDEDDYYRKYSDFLNSKCKS